MKFIAAVTLVSLALAVPNPSTTNGAGTTVTLPPPITLPPLTTTTEVCSTTTTTAAAGTATTATTTTTAAGVFRTTTGGYGYSSASAPTTKAPDASYEQKTPCDSSAAVPTKVTLGPNVTPTKALYPEEYPTAGPTGGIYGNHAPDAVHPIYSSAQGVAASLSGAALLAFLAL